tara:strand:- start:93 stop:266 length:174 start_codon:yes stop_codon:yes gene_type:complete
MLNPLKLSGIKRFTEMASKAGEKAVAAGKGIGTSAKNISKGSIDKVKKLNPFSKKEK